MTIATPQWHGRHLGTVLCLSSQRTAASPVRRLPTRRTASVSMGRPDVLDAERQSSVAKRTRLSNRDRDIFLALLDDIQAQPNDALREAAAAYKRQIS